MVKIIQAIIQVLIVFISTVNDNLGITGKDDGQGLGISLVLEVKSTLLLSFNSTVEN